MERYRLVKKIVSPKGEGYFPQFEDVAYKIKNENGNDAYSFSNFPAAHEKLVELREKELMTLRKKSNG